MRRRLSSPAAAPAAAPVAPAPAPAPAPVATPIQPQVLPPAPAQPQADAGSAGTALSVLSPDLLALFDYREPEVPLPSGGDGLRAARIGFISGRGQYAGDIARALPGMPLGTPYLLTPDSRYWSLSGLVVMQLDQLAYWGATDDQYTLLWASTSPQGRKAKVTIGGEERRIAECMIAIHLILPGSQPLPPDLAPGFVAVTHFRGATTSAPAELERAIGDTTSPEWARSGNNGALAGLKPRMRVVATIQGESKPVRGQNRTYSKSSAIVMPTGAAQMQALAAWGQTEECQSELEEALAYFDDEVTTIKQLAAASAAQAAAQ